MATRKWIVFAVLFVALLSACGNSNVPTPGGSASFADRCTKTEDCASSLCVRLDAKGGLCTRTCNGAADCPASSNWRCVQPDGLGASVCACHVTSAVEICDNGIDDDCNGKIDDCPVCNGEKVSPVQFQTDAANCGACGNACGSGSTCVDGGCTCPDSKLPNLCPGVGCVSFGGDAHNCGACGKSCPSAQACVAGQCACPKASPDFCDPTCVDSTKDAKNCGKCGNTCLAEQYCFNGACECPASRHLVCGGHCVDPNSDRNNCGSCGNACDAGLSCVNGSCACYSASLTYCNGTCTALATDVSNCGACGTACAPGETCSASTCRCASNLHCSGTCVAQNDVNNCGACGNACGVAQYCFSNACVCSGFGQTACGTACVNEQTDPTNCGACGRVCPSTQVCTNGSCACPAGKTWCAQLGACVDLQRDAANCGACGRACRATEACISGTCVCPSPNLRWCASSGACIDTVSNSADCGACDNACPAQTHCASSRCTCNSSSLTLCGASCVDLQNDRNNCARCGNTCDGNTQCMSGVCRCPQPLLGAPIRLTTTATATQRPTAVWNGTNVGVVYNEYGPGGGVRFRLLAPDGSLASPEVVVDMTQPITAPDLVWTGSEWGVLWVVGSVSTPTYRFMRMAPNGGQPYAPVTISPTPANLGTNSFDPRLAWSPVYGGYAMVGIGNGNLDLKLLGADGSAANAINTVSSSSSSSFGDRPAIVVNPSGHFGVFTARWESYVTDFNPDGSRTLAPVEINQYATGGAGMAWDGSNWILAWAREMAIGSSDVVVHRGASSSNGYTVAQQTGTNVKTRGIGLTLTGNFATLAWQLYLQSGSANQMYMARLRQPAAPGDGFAPIVDNFAAVDTTTIPDSGASTGNETSFVHVAPSTVLVVWSDNRWGAPELYARVVDFQACP